MCGHACAPSIKTAAPMRPLALILSPTRELAMQISDVIAPLSRTVNLNSQVVAGGLSYSKQIQATKQLQDTLSEVEHLVDIDSSVEHEAVKQILEIGVPAIFSLSSGCHLL